MFLIEQAFDSACVCFGKVHHMDVVANASAIRSVVIVAKDKNLLLSSSGHLGHERKQIVGDP